MSEPWELRGQELLAHVAEATGPIEPGWFNQFLLLGFSMYGDLFTEALAQQMGGDA